MSKEVYSKNEIDMKFKNRDLMFEHVDEKLERILVQTTMHNGRLKKIEKCLIIVGTAVAVLLITNGSEFIGFVSDVFI